MTPKGGFPTRRQAKEIREVEQLTQHYEQLQAFKMFNVVFSADTPDIPALEPAHLPSVADRAA